MSLLIDYLVTGKMFTEWLAKWYADILNNMPKNLWTREVSEFWMGDHQLASQPPAKHQQAKTEPPSGDSGVMTLDSRHWMDRPTSRVVDHNGLIIVLIKDLIYFDMGIKWSYSDGWPIFSFRYLLEYVSIPFYVETLFSNFRYHEWHHPDPLIPLWLNLFLYYL